MVEEHLEHRLAVLEQGRPPYPGPCQDGGCEWVDLPLTRQFSRRGVRMVFRRECRKCKRFYGYGTEDNRRPADAGSQA